MSRVWGIIKNDMYFQRRTGIYLLYLMLTILYLAVSHAIPADLKKVVAELLIFTDPAAMGLYFMGAILLLERSQHLERAIFVSPVRIREYVAGKAVSLGVIATVAALILQLSVDRSGLTVGYFCGVVFSEMIFSFFGLIVATKIRDLNQFVLATVPIELAGFVPVIFSISGIRQSVLAYYPTVICFHLIGGEKINGVQWLEVGALTLLLAVAAENSVRKLWYGCSGKKGER